MMITKWEDLNKALLDYHERGTNYGLVDFEIAGEHNGKNKLSIRKSSSVLTKEGLLIRPIYSAGDVLMDKPIFYLYFAFDPDLKDFWGEMKSELNPDVVYPYYQILGINIGNS